MQAVDTDGNGRITYQGGCVLSDRIARVLTRFENSANSYTKPKRSFSTCSRPSTTTTTARSPRTSCAQLCERPASQCPTVISTSSFRKWTPTMMGPSVLKNGGMYPVSLRSSQRVEWRWHHTRWQREQTETIVVCPKTATRSRDVLHGCRIEDIRESY